MLRKLLILFLFLFSTRGFAQNFHLLELDTFSMEYWKIEDQREGYTQYDKPGTGNGKEEWRGGAAANFDLNLISYKGLGLYWDNKVFMNGTDHQVRHVGWQWEAGIGLGKSVDVFWYHKSQHVLDATYEEKFPLENHYGVRYIWYERDPSVRNRR